MFTLGGWWRMKWRAKVRVQNGDKVQVKPKNQLGRAMPVP